MRSEAQGSHDPEGIVTVAKQAAFWEKVFAPVGLVTFLLGAMMINTSWG